VLKGPLVFHAKFCSLGADYEVLKKCANLAISGTTFQQKLSSLGNDQINHPQWLKT
jgi:hypothetical protein